MAGVIGAFGPGFQLAEIELGEEIRRRYCDLPVVLTSGNNDVLAQSGTHGFELLQKPYSVDELSRALRRRR